MLFSLSLLCIFSLLLLLPLPTLPFLLHAKASPSGHFYLSPTSFLVNLPPTACFMLHAHKFSSTLALFLLYTIFYSPFLFLLYVAISGNEECWEHAGTDNGTLKHGKDLRNAGQCHQSHRVTAKGEENPELVC